MTYSRHAKQDHKARRQFMATLGIGTLLLVAPYNNTCMYNYYDNGIVEITNMEQTKVITRMLPNPSRLETVYKDQATNEMLALARTLQKQYRAYVKELYR